MVGPVGRDSLRAYGGEGLITLRSGLTFRDIDYVIIIFVYGFVVLKSARDRIVSVCAT